MNKLTELMPQVKYVARWTTPGFPDDLVNLPWVKHADAPRKEYFCGLGKPYTYGRPPRSRTYESQPWPLTAQAQLSLLNATRMHDYSVCFLNFYTGPSDNLGWHADDSPEMDPDHPIAVVSYGGPRLFQIRANPTTTNKMPVLASYELASGSLIVMPSGFQQHFQHRILKSSEQGNQRISLTFRRYREVP